MCWNRELTITGGELWALGSAGMGDSPSTSSSQAWVQASVDLQGGEDVTVADAEGTPIASLTSEKTPKMSSTLRRRSQRVRRTRSTARMSSLTQPPRMAWGEAARWALNRAGHLPVACPTVSRELRPRSGTRKLRCFPRTGVRGLSEAARHHAGAVAGPTACPAAVAGAIEAGQEGTLPETSASQPRR